LTKLQTYKFSTTSVRYYLSSAFSQLKKIADRKTAILVTDENVYNAHPAIFEAWNTIIIEPGEQHKLQTTADDIIEELVSIEAGRDNLLIGVGGGVVTDITGYVASVYLRGIPFGFIPTSLLGMVDASIGGKNGVDVGVYKNMVGTIRQPDFILQDTALLQTLPEEEWQNGFAEIIKHACIKDAVMFRELEARSVSDFMQNKKLLDNLIERNMVLKTRIVQRDEFEKNERRLLNFGHTLGHALENLHQIKHGHAVSIGMAAASLFSEKLVGFKNRERIHSLLEKYGLPVSFPFDKEKVLDVLRHDKKRVRKEINYVLLERIGKAVIKPIPLQKLDKMISSL
jgi:3-dehydroquinate synthase